jgi:hypothetical protein
MPTNGNLGSDIVNATNIRSNLRIYVSPKYESDVWV